MQAVFMPLRKRIGWTPLLVVEVFGSLKLPSFNVLKGYALLLLFFCLGVWRTYLIYRLKNELISYLGANHFPFFLCALLLADGNIASLCLRIHTCANSLCDYIWELVFGIDMCQDKNRSQIVSKILFKFKFCRST